MKAISGVGQLDCRIKIGIKNQITQKKRWEKHSISQNIVNILYLLFLMIIGVGGILNELGLLEVHYPVNLSKLNGTDNYSFDFGACFFIFK